MLGADPAWASGSVEHSRQRNARYTTVFLPRTRTGSVGDALGAEVAQGGADLLGGGVE